MRRQFFGRWLGTLVAAALGLTGCLSGWKYGAAAIYRTVDLNGVPRYTAWGKLYDDETWEMKATKVMLAACPDGDPQLLSGSVTTSEGQQAGTTWDADFTCNHPIPGIETLSAAIPPD